MNELYEAIKTISESDIQTIKREEYNGHYFYEPCPKCEEKIAIAKKALRTFGKKKQGRPRAYLIRVVTWDDLDKLDREQMMRFAYEMNTVLPVHHAEIFNEDDFMKECDDLATWNEIDLDKLFVNILHIPEENVSRVLRPWEINE